MTTHQLLKQTTFWAVKNILKKDYLSGPETDHLLGRKEQPEKRLPTSSRSKIINWRVKHILKIGYLTGPETNHLLRRLSHPEKRLPISS